MADAKLGAAATAGEERVSWLATWGADATLQAAALLQGPFQEDAIAATAIEAACGARVAWLCTEFRRLLTGAPDPNWGGHPLVLLRVRAYSAAYRDPDLAFLYVADAWQRFFPGDQTGALRRQVAIEEARLALIPLLDMLGMRALRRSLEEVLTPDELVTPEDSANARQAIDAVLTPHLPGADFVYTRHTPATLTGGTGAKTGGRSQHALNVTMLLEDEDACFHALGVVQRCFIPIEGAIIDHLHAPKPNGYRSLHVAVVAQLPFGRTRVNFALTPRAQHEIKEWGIAALRMRGHAPAPIANAWWNDAAASYAQISTGAPGSLPERLYVFSPQGQLFGFERGSTVVDYAYHVHSDLAEQCRRFLVNGKAVEPPTVLRHLDLVELEHDPKAPGPSRIWLHAAYTTRARTAIDRYLKRQGQGSHHGQKIIEERLKTLERYYGFNLPAEKIELAILDAVRRENLVRREDLLEAIAAGQFAADMLFHRHFEREIVRQVEIPRTIPLRHHSLHLAQCCRPRPGDNIVGRIYRRHGEIVNMAVHAEGCLRIAGHPDTTPLRWRLQQQLITLARVDLRALDDAGLLGAAVAEIYARQPRVTLHRVHASARLGTATLQFDLQADQAATVQEIVEALRRLPNYVVSDVSSLHLPPSEQEQFGESNFNPYSRLPVYEDAMFFGRNQERQRITECLRTRQPSLWLIGQKRLGKTSLLLHLKDHELPAQGFAPVFIDFQLIGHPARTNVFFDVALAVHTALSTDVRLGAVGAPIRSLFDGDPARQLIDYLISVQDLLGARRLVLLMDEFSRLTDAYLLGQVEAALFDSWRAVLHATQRAGIGYVVVMQQQTRDTLVKWLEQHPDDPSWRLMDVGQPLYLRPLSEADVRRLIEWPMRNHLEYSPEIVDRVASLTGGSPFLIQAFCHNLVMHMAHQPHHAVTQEDLERVRTEFMQPQDHTFAHMTEMMKGISNHVAATLARLGSEQPDRQVTWARLRVALPNVAPDSLRSSLRTLTDLDILIQPGADRWQFANLLFEQWLAINGA
ncbi:MAG: TGS domain-containing protein [Anaerolineales bacterium]|nr:TGS domain-containing protein [Anaerolineales bacterium]